MGKAAEAGGLEGVTGLYAGMVASVEEQMGSKRLGELFAEVRSAEVSDPLPVVDDEEVQRFLARFGLMQGRGGEVSDALPDITQAMATASDRDAAQVSLVLRLFTSGLYGVASEPVCGTVPQCLKCRISKRCAFHNAPPSRKARSGLTLSQRVSREGAKSISDEDVVSLLLGGSRASDTHRKTAKSLLVRFGSMRGLASATLGELSGLRDVSQAGALRLAAAAAFHSRVLAERKSLGSVVRTARDFFDLYQGALRELRHEVFMVVLLNQKNRILKEVEASAGTLTASLVHPREVFRPAIREAAAAVAFVHNHPSGDPTPSPEDLAITKRLLKAGDLLGIRVLDHVIIGEGEYVSLLESGRLGKDENGSGGDAGIREGPGDPRV